MRVIGTLTQGDLARRFRDYALTQGIELMVESEDEAWSVWVYEEDQIEQATDELARFNEDPDNQRYAQADQAAEELRKEAEKREEMLRKNQIDVRARWERPMWQQCQVTTAMIAISVLVAITTNIGEKHEPVIKLLSISPYQFEGGYSDPGLEPILQGQIWRPLTPIFIHFGIMHVLFNMLWLRDLGMNIEFRIGGLRYTLLVLAIAVSSNFAQYLSTGPTFGGMSGVVFGLFGYIWMRGRLEPESGFYIHPNIVFLMIAWFVICMTGAVGHIANVAHGGGLAVGMLLGAAPSLRKRIA